MEEKKNISSILENAGIRPLSHRIAIYSYLDEHRVHPSADDIYRDLVREIPTLSKTTVYNTLKLFCQHSLTREVLVQGRESLYDADISNHAHFMCTKCQKVFDLPEPKLEIPTLPDGFVIQQIHVDYRGLCPSCH